MNNFSPGEAIHCYLSDVASSSGAITDPTPLLFAYWPPNSAVAVATTAAGITDGASSGQFYAQVVATTSQIGMWHYRWSSTGDYKISQWGAFKVLEPPRST